jgi:L-lactate dehydrogenase complex protein LldG
MAADSVAAFEAALRDVEATVTRTTPGGCAAAVDAAVRPPAVGVEPPFPTATLPDSVRTDPTVGELESARTGVTPATLGIADYGSVVLEADPAGTEPISLFPDRHVAVLRAADVVPDMPTAFDRFDEVVGGARRSAGVATGPSATADMGGLVLGAHGPESVHVVLVTDGEAEADDGVDAGDRGVDG